MVRHGIIHHRQEQENDEVKKAPARVEKFVKESLDKEEDDPADENAVKVLWVNPQMPLQ